MPRRFQFSLRSMFWAAAFVAVLCVAGSAVWNRSAILNQGAALLAFLSFSSGLFGAFVGASWGEGVGHPRAGAIALGTAALMVWPTIFVLLLALVPIQ